MKKYIKYLVMATACVGMTSGLTSCNDFFDPKTDDSLDGDKYMSSLTEMSTGYLGILTKLQAIGDKSIYLTDTRGELLEPTDRSIADLIAIYNYDDDLSGNAYADPAGYYDLVIACNDYLSKMIDFKKVYPELVDETTYYEGLVGSTLRMKAWAYLTIVKIYGQALWFDDPILKIEDLTDTSKFELLTLDQTVDKCIDIMTNGYQGYSAEATFSWVAWLDPDNVTNIANSAYRYWDNMTPPYEGVLSELYLWKGAALDAVHADASWYYDQVSTMMLKKLDETFTGNMRYWSRTAYTVSHYASFFDYSNPYGEECVSAITYDYTQNQSNQILKHFSDEYPNSYLLRPSEVGRGRWEDNTFNPGYEVSSEKRGGVTCKQHNGNWYVGKYRPVGSTQRVNAYQDDCHIYTYRGGDYLFMLAEALNNSGRFKAADGILNTGVNAYRSMIVEVMADTCKDESTTREWKGFTLNWTANLASGSSNKYYYLGIRGCWSLDPRTLVADEKEKNDSFIADEYLLEFGAEARVYPALIRFAKRWNKPSFITDRVTPKYGDKAAEIESKITSNNPITGMPGYFVPWDLKIAK